MNDMKDLVKAVLVMAGLAILGWTIVVYVGVKVVDWVWR